MEGNSKSLIQTLIESGDLFDVQLEVYLTGQS
jgi:hypothetical protein